MFCASALSHHSALSLTHVSLTITLMFTSHLPLLISSHKLTPMYKSLPHVSTLCQSVFPPFHYQSYSPINQPQHRHHKCNKNIVTYTLSSEFPNSLLIFQLLIFYCI